MDQLGVETRLKKDLLFIWVSSVLWPVKTDEVLAILVLDFDLQKDQLLAILLLALSREV